MELPPFEENSFGDVTPLTTNELSPLSILITDSDSRLFGYFYALVQAQERSERVLNLTLHIIAVNSANYTAWQTRRKCIEVLDFSFDKYNDELSVVDAWCARNPKNYQVWFHRRWVIDRICDDHPSVQKLVDSELLRLEESFNEEPKNYNAWSHRLYISRKFNLLNTDQELEFTSRILRQDVRNNSAWSYRRQIVSQRHDLMQKEIKFTIEMIILSPGNESAWIYLRSLPSWATQIFEHPDMSKLFGNITQSTVLSLNMRYASETFIISLKDKAMTPESYKMKNNLIISDSIREKSLKYRFSSFPEHR
jgi:protein farnesyltransferase/geranylgeranyltransferase type-1 subunit alpha